MRNKMWAARSTFNDREAEIPSLAARAISLPAHQSWTLAAVADWVSPTAEGSLKSFARLSLVVASLTAVMTVPELKAAAVVARGGNIVMVNLHLDDMKITHT